MKKPAPLLALMLLITLAARPAAFTSGRPAEGTCDNNSPRPVENTRSIALASIPSMDDERSAPLNYAVSRNVPDPFNASTVINYSLPHRSKVKLSIYDAKGRLVESLVDEVQRAGQKSVEWFAANFPAGTYFYRLDAHPIDDPSVRFAEAGRMILVK